MKMNHIKNTKNIVSIYLNQFIEEGDVCLDATIGNGYDTRVIAKLVGNKGKVYGFDIQEVAIENTKELLAFEDMAERVELINDSHENIDQYINENLNFIIYNLGYLPKGDKNIKTNEYSTVRSIKKALNLMIHHSIMLITTYVGHAGGPEENEAVIKFLTSLDQKKFNVVKYEFINQQNSPPMLYAVEKL